MGFGFIHGFIGIADQHFFIFSMHGVDADTNLTLYLDVVMLNQERFTQYGF